MIGHDYSDPRHPVRADPLHDRPASMSPASIACLHCSAPAAVTISTDTSTADVLAHLAENVRRTSNREHVEEVAARARRTAGQPARRTAPDLIDVRRGPASSTRQ